MNNKPAIAVVIAAMLMTACGSNDETNAKMESMAAEMESMRQVINETTTSIATTTVATTTEETTTEETTTTPEPTTTTEETTTSPAPTTTTAVPTTTAPPPTTTTAAPTTTVAPETTAATTAAPAEYTVKFKSGGKTLSTQTVKAGSAAKPPSAKEVMEKTHLVFIGWDSDYDNITEDTDIYAELDTFRLELFEHSYNGGTIKCRWRCNSMLYYEMYEKKQNLILDRATIRGGSWDFYTQSSDTSADGSGIITATAKVNGDPTVYVDGEKVAP